MQRGKIGFRRAKWSTGPFRPLRGTLLKDRFEGRTRRAQASRRGKPGEAGHTTLCVLSRLLDTILQAKLGAGRVKAALLILLVAIVAGCAWLWFSGRSTETCRVPRPGWVTPSDPTHRMVEVVQISLDKSGTIRWNGLVIDRPRLSSFLQEGPSMNPMPFYAFQPAPQAPCSTVIEIRREMERVLKCSETGACGEGVGWRRW